MKTGLTGTLKQFTERACIQLITPFRCPDLAGILVQGRQWTKAGGDRQLIIVRTSQNQHASGSMLHCCPFVCPPPVIQHSCSRPCILADAGSIKKSLQPKKSELISITPNSVDEIWHDRPPRPKNPVFHLDVKYSGEMRPCKVISFTKDNVCRPISHG